MFERRDLVGGLCLYALYRKLLPPNVTPDAKLHKYMWEIQKVVPCVVLADTVLFCPGAASIPLSVSDNNHNDDYDDDDDGGGGGGGDNDDEYTNLCLSSLCFLLFLFIYSSLSISLLLPSFLPSFTISLYIIIIIRRILAPTCILRDQEA